jgi:two-component system, LytTR family, sensor kinase
VPGFISNRKLRFLLPFVVWNALGLIVSYQIYASSSFAGHPIPLSQLLRTELIDCNAWALLTPAIFWLTRRNFPDGRAKTMLRVCLVHLLAAVACVFVQPAICAILQQVAPAFGSEVRSFAETFARALKMNLVMIVISYAQIVLVALMLESFRRYRSGRERTERLERHLAEARLEALQMQLQPHFLFNTLNAIASLIHVNPEQADKMVSRLGDLLRAALNHSHLHEVTLAEELAFLEKYLDIEQVRFGDRLAVRFEIDDVVRDVLVPNLILQPLVENAIRHGISQRPGPGEIIIRAHPAADETAVAIEVCDNGVGLEASHAAGSGVGLENTRARLDQLYGEEAFRLDLVPRREGGVRVALMIPLIREPAGETPAPARSAPRTEPAVLPDSLGHRASPAG